MTLGFEAWSSIAKSGKKRFGLAAIFIVAIFLITNSVFPSFAQAATTTQLNNSIVAAQAAYDAAVVGTHPGEYSAASKATLQAAIDAATVVKNTSNSQPTINAAKATLDTALTTFYSSVVPAPDKTALNTAIANAQTLYTNAVVGDHPGEYAAASKVTLQAAIDAATLVSTGSTYNQTEVDSATTTLNAAVATFTASVVPSPDTTDLAASIAAAQNVYDNATEGTHPGEFTVASKATLQAAIDAATTVKNDPTSNQAEVDAAKTTLDAAVVTFNNSVVPVPDTSALDLSITVANAAVTAALPGGDHPGQYTIASITTLQNAISAATTVKNDPTSNQTEVDAAKTTLDTALSDFLASVVGPADTSALSVSITTASTAVSTASPGGDHPGEYTPASIATLQAAIDAATLVKNDSNSSQSEVDTAKTTLDNALSDFLSSVVPSPDTTNLMTSITVAQAAHDAAVIGDNPGEYAAGAVTILQAAIDAATTVKNNPTSNQTEVDAAKTTLDAAVVTFNNSVVPVPDTTILSTAITNAQAVYAAAVEGNQPGQFSTASKATFQAAIDAAIAVKNDPTSNQAEVDAAKSALDAALTVFNASQIPSSGGGGSVTSGGGGFFLPVTPPVTVTPPSSIPSVAPVGQVLGARTWANGSLVKTAESSTVYIAVNDTLRPFGSAAVFKAMGLKFENVKIITVEDLAGSTIGKPMGYPEGTLIKGSGKTIYVVGSNGTKLGIPSMSVFNKKKYSMKKVVKLSDAELSSYGDGGVIQ